MDRALRLSKQGLIDREVAALTGVSIGAVQKWRFSKPTTISVAKKEAVTRLDEFVGPKY